MHTLSIAKYNPHNGHYDHYANDTITDTELTAVVLYFRDRPVIPGFYQLSVVHSGTHMSWYTCHGDLLGFLKANHNRLT